MENKMSVFKIKLVMMELSWVHSSQSTVVKKKSKILQMYAKSNINV